jgi:hypothetical protein
VLPSKLSLQNAAAALTLPLYLPRRALGNGRAARTGTDRVSSARWVIGGHSGRVYADNAATLHQRLCAEGRDVTWISADDAITALLRERGAKVRTRNSWAARRAIDAADVLAYSHGPSDLDHLLLRHFRVGGLRVHLNHCMSHVKTWGSHPQTALPDGVLRAPPSDAFDYMLASSERERRNLQRSFAGAGARIVLGGGAHLDPFMAARGQPTKRTIVYFPTFRDTPTGTAALDRAVRALATDQRLHAYLERDDFELCIVGHVNTRGAEERAAGHARVRFATAQHLLDELLGSAALISDYSGVICDYLALCRPLAFFPFDKAEYLRTRELYVSYDELVCGPEVHDVPALVELIVSGALLAKGPHEARRRYWEGELFPELTPSYAARTLATIDGLVERFWQRGGGTRG